MGAVLHTLNIRLFPEQLAFVVNHAEDKVVIVDGSIAPLFARVRAECKTVAHVIVVGDGDTTGLGDTVSYDDLVDAEEPGYPWPALDERQAASMCYTSGTTGNPKGVVYSHRSTWLHAFAGMNTNCVGASEADRVLVIVPMFHANAWGMPYTAFFAGTDLIFPERFLQAEPLARIIAEQRPTLSLGVPTIWNDLLRYSQGHDVDLSSLRLLTAGGAAVPRVAHGGVPGTLRHRHDPGLGDDRDQPRVCLRAASEGRCARTGDGLAGQDGSCHRRRGASGRRRRG